jgi:glutamate-1-semialdehyde 2,1-aminomutase/spore coat polysaccharide biosynthesis protein SpsF
VISNFDTSNALQKRALQTIPLASQTFSKAAMQTVEGAAPLFVKRGEGCRIWDVDGNCYIDFVLGLLPVVLGYRDPTVDAALLAQLDNGISFSLSTELEIRLAEELVRLIPCAEMVRFGKNGSDATTAAIRLARAHTGRDKVAVCGYHGWHDWYIGTTPRDLGVPAAVSDLSAPFPFNDADALASLLAGDPDGFAAVIMEPAGLDNPAPGFLQAVRDLCDRHGVVLVFDEIVTGFRLALGGAQAHYDVTPDLTSVGKALGNGMPISAVVGRRDIMRRMEDIFFSGTFGGEAMSIAAALATLEVLESEDAPARFARTGARLREGARTIIGEAGLGPCFSVKGPDWWPAILPAANGPVDANLTASLLKQELIARGVLMGPTFNLCLAHADDAVIEEALSALTDAAAAVAEALTLDDPSTALRGKAMQPVFRVRPQTGAAS